MDTNNARNLINTLIRDQAAMHGQEFIAPLLRDGRVRLRLRGLIYELRVAGAQPGWWRCRVLDERRAEVLEEAWPWQRGEYLALWPALRLVLVAPLHYLQRPQLSWVALPFNPSDATQRFGIGGPLVVQLVDGGQPFERVLGRVEGGTVWFDDLDRRADPATAEALRAALAAGHETPTVAGLGAGEQAAYALCVEQAAAQHAAHTTAHTERRLRQALSIGGAQLVGYEVVGEGLRITWEHTGQRSVTLVDADLGVLSAGICLSGEDHKFDLASVVGVVRDAPGYAAWDE